MGVRIDKVVITLLIVLTLVDAGFLIKYLIVHRETTTLTTEARLITFIVCHCYFAVMLGMQYGLQDRHIQEHVLIYKYSEWLVYTFVPIVALETLVEIVMFLAIGPEQRHVLRMQQGDYSPTISLLSGDVQQQSLQQQQQQQQLLSLQRQQQLHIINFYFLIYMYSTILAILSALYLAVNTMLEGLERRRYDDLVNEIVENCMEVCDRGDDRLRDKECSICQFGWVGQSFNQNNASNTGNNQASQLNSLNSKVEVAHLQCSHMFHKECILQWVKKTYQQSLPARCPNCRRLIST